MLLELLKAVVARETDKVSASSRAGSVFRFLLSVVRASIYQIVWDGHNGWRVLDPKDPYDMHSTVKLFSKEHLHRALPLVSFSDFL